MDPDEQTTVTYDERYNLISMLYYPLPGAEASERTELYGSSRKVQVA